MEEAKKKKEEENIPTVHHGEKKRENITEFTCLNKNRDVIH